jgi:hypothetical protein
MELRADGVFATEDGRPAFSSPLSIPKDMGLGWWGVAPWSPEFGRAAVTVREVSGGPMPVRIAHLSYPENGEAPRNRARRNFQPGTRGTALTRPRTPGELDHLQSVIQTLSVLIPDWYSPLWDGTLFGGAEADDLEVRLLARFYRVRLMPRLDFSNEELIPWEELRAVARRDRLDGFTLYLPKMPGEDWIAATEDRMLDMGLDLLLAVEEPGGGRMLIREIQPRVGLFKGPRRSLAVDIVDLPFPSPAAPVPEGPHHLFLRL